MRCQGRNWMPGRLDSAFECRVVLCLQRVTPSGGDILGAVSKFIRSLHSVQFFRCGSHSPSSSRLRLHRYHRRAYGCSFLIA